MKLKLQIVDYDSDLLLKKRTSELMTFAKLMKSKLISPRFNAHHDVFYVEFPHSMSHYHQAFVLNAFLSYCNIHENILHELRVDFE